MHVLNTLCNPASQRQESHSLLICPQIQVTTISMLRSWAGSSCLTTAGMAVTQHICTYARSPLLQSLAVFYIFWQASIPHSSIRKFWKILGNLLRHYPKNNMVAGNHFLYYLSCFLSFCFPHWRFKDKQNTKIWYSSMGSEVRAPGLEL